MVRVISSGRLRVDNGPHMQAAVAASFEVILARHRRSSGVARRYLRDFLGQVPDGAGFLDSGALVIGELVANAVVHARVSPGREIAVRLEMVHGHLRIEVHDASNERPGIRRSTGLDDVSGRGLRLVEELSSEWGWGPRPEGIGKIVWALVGPEGGA
ncbi:ATP-binding protein [Kitasatospora herbaricolor]|uniref:ATP-binding protein n=1 Tax=Kitasatospora herbaricolor TaxID=68217 RepID=A0ABZ1W921_9ACTN|nr:ATP-binding protein [Kitasatospora herbaricolor]